MPYRSWSVRRLCAIAPEPLENAAAWFDPFRRFWQPHLDALGTELARGRRQRRLAADEEQHTDAEPDESDTTDPQEE